MKRSRFRSVPCRTPFTKLLADSAENENRVLQTSRKVAAIRDSHEYKTTNFPNIPRVRRLYPSSKAVER